MIETTRTMTVELTFIEKYEEGNEPVEANENTYKEWIKRRLNPDDIVVKNLREFIREDGE